MRNLLQISDTTISMGHDIPRNATWIQQSLKTIGVQACCVNDHVKSSPPGFRENLLVTKGLFREAESPLRTAAAILRSELTLPRMFQLINAIVGSVSRIWTPAVKSSTIGVERQRTLVITAMTMPKIGIKVRIKVRTTAKTRIGIGTRDLSETQGVVAETQNRIVAATLEREWTITRSARGICGTRRTVKTQVKGVTTSLFIQRRIDQATVSVLKLMMIIQMYGRFSMLRR